MELVCLGSGHCTSVGSVVARMRGHSKQVVVGACVYTLYMCTCIVCKCIKVWPVCANICTVYHCKFNDLVSTRAGPIICLFFSFASDS